MKKIFTLISLIGMLFSLLACRSSGGTVTVTDTSTPIALPLDTQGNLIKNTSLRSGPGTSFDEIGQLPEGKNVHIIGTSIDIKWYQITYDDSQGIVIRGWIPVESVKLELFSPTQSIANTESIQPISTLTFTSTFIAPVITVTATPTGTPTRIPITPPTPTNTAMPIYTFPSPIDEEANVMIVFDTISATLINISNNPISITGIDLVRIDYRGNQTASFNSDSWINVTSKTSALPPNDCLMINTKKSSRPTACSSAWGFITTSQQQYYFWIETTDSQQFQVWKNGELLKTCDITFGSCQFYLPQP